MANLDQFMRQAQQNWAETVEKAKSSSFENLPDGQYIVQLSSAELCESKAGKVQTKWGFTILEGDLAGQTKYDYVGLEGQRGLEPLAWRLSSFGSKIEDVNLSKLQEYFDDLVTQNLVMKITMKTSPGTDFQNVKVNKLLPNYHDSGDDGIGSTSVSRNGSHSASQDETVELSAGMRVTFEYKGKDKTGTVKSFNSENGLAQITSGKETLEVALADIGGVIEEGTDA